VHIDGATLQRLYTIYLCNSRGTVLVGTHLKRPFNFQTCFCPTSSAESFRSPFGRMTGRDPAVQRSLNKARERMMGEEVVHKPVCFQPAFIAYIQLSCISCWRQVQQQHRQRGQTSSFYIHKPKPKHISQLFFPHEALHPKLFLLAVLLPSRPRKYRYPTLPKPLNSDEPTQHEQIPSTVCLWAHRNHIRAASPAMPLGSG
jgi:hypothetical protein